MGNYKELKGSLVTTLTADPPAAIAQGDIWYRSDTDKYKMGAQVGAWSAGGAFSFPFVGAGSGGTSTAMIAYSGKGTSPGPSFPTSTWFYNGTAWTDQSADLVNASRGYNASTGTQAGAICAGGHPPGGTFAEEWVGEAWAGLTLLPTGRRYCQGFGGTSSFVVAGGSTWAGPGMTLSSVVESWNGSSWTTGTSTPRAWNATGGAGAETTGILSGGGGSPVAPGAYDETFTYNGTSWTTETAYPTAVDSQGYAGDQSATLCFGGNTPAPGRSVNTFTYNGTAWTAQGDLTTGRSAGSSSFTGTTSAATFSGGTMPGNTDATEEYAFGDGIKSITTS